MKPIFFFLLFPTVLFSFALEPWYASFPECEFRVSGAYRFTPSLDQKREKKKSRPFHDSLIHLNGGMQFWPNWEIQMQTDCLKTKKSNWEVERFGIQIRSLLLNDIAGDLMSVSLGLQGYYVPMNALQKVISPYHSQGNLEAGLSVGKEMGPFDAWSVRWFYFLGIGIGNRGAPWLRPLISFDINIFQKGQCGLFSEGYFGLGRSHRLCVDAFNGYGNIAHRSIDCGVHYTYQFEVWGAIRFAYVQRVYAVLFPHRVRMVQLEYRFPFSMF